MKSPGTGIIILFTAGLSLVVAQSLSRHPARLAGIWSASSRQYGQSISAAQYSDEPVNLDR